MVVLLVVIVVTATLLAALLLLVGRTGVGEQRAARLPASLLQVTAAPSRLLTARRPALRARSGESRSEDSSEASTRAVAHLRRRRRGRRGPALDDPAEVERLVREQLYGRPGRRG